MVGSTRNVPLLIAGIATVAALVVAFVHARVTPLPGLQAIEGLTVDARFKLRGPRAPTTDRVVIVALDDATRREAPDVLQTRRGYARLVDAITAYDPKLIAFDLFFESPEIVLPPPLAARVRALETAMPAETGPEVREVISAVAAELRGDELLAEAIARAKRVYLGAMFYLGAAAEGAAEPVGLDDARHGQISDGGRGGTRRPATAYAVSTALPAIAAGAVGMGALNNFQDDDGVTRRLPLLVEFAGRHYMPLGLAVALAELGRDGDTRYRIGDRTLRAAGREVPVSKSASIVLDVLGKDRIPRVSAADVLAGRTPKSALAGKLVFVGLTYAAYDKVATPLDRVVDGVELHATLTENVLGGRLLRETGAVMTVLATLLLCGLVCLAQRRRVRRRPWVPPVVALGAIALWVAFAIVMFGRGAIVPIAVPCVSAAVVMLAAAIGGLATEGRDKARLRSMFSQYVSGPVVDRILADPARAKLGGERKELTVLFSDIRGFSQFSEGMAPEELAAFLGEYLTPMTELVLASGGTLDKYIGDAVMAIWGAPVDMDDHAERACEVALRMQETLVELNRGWDKAGKPAVSIGVGINTGAMAVGNMGSAARFDYTVLGDQVNLGARLEALTKEYGIDILVGEATARAAAGRFAFREIDLVRVKGRAGAVPVFELVGRAGARVEPAFVDALAAYRRGEFAEARAQFAAMADDPVAFTMAARCEVLAAMPPAAEWDGVYEQRGK